MKIELTPQSEADLKTGILELIENYLEAREKVKPRILGLMTAEQLKNELDIEYKTLQRWEKNGLRRYQPPLEDTRKIFYRVSDILIFLGVENGKI
ncbi:TPA: XRE family transcriptional regulator [Streptococcus suis]